MLKDAARRILASFRKVNPGARTGRGGALPVHFFANGSLPFLVGVPGLAK